MVKAFRGQETSFRIRIGALSHKEPGRLLFENEFFDDSEKLYLGNKTRSDYYLGTRTDQEIYLGSIKLF
jgi:hypothetical protein